MRLYRKLYHKLKNTLLALWWGKKANAGCLPHLEDKRDHIASLGALGLYKTQQETLSYFRYQFEQQDNICVYASGVLGLSEQTGVRFSIKFAVKLAKKLGYIKGNGWSYLRAFHKIATKHGLIPYELMPDDKNEGWAEYSKWTPECDKLLADVAPKFKFTEYKQLRTESAVLEAIDQGFVPLTASNWFNERPQGPKFLLKLLGNFVGGHAWRSPGYRAWGEDNQVPNTFGESWGDKGKAWIETLFQKNMHAVYIVSYKDNPSLPTNNIIDLFEKQSEGLMVRTVGESECFFIQDGVKQWVSGEDGMKTFFQTFDKVGITYVKQALLDLVPRGDDYPFVNS